VGPPGAPLPTVDCNRSVKAIYQQLSTSEVYALPMSGLRKTRPGAVILNQFFCGRCIDILRRLNGVDAELSAATACRVSPLPGQPASRFA